MPCLECSTPIVGKRAGARFCSRAHAKQFGNRAMTRGAPMYHLVCAIRRERSKAKRLNLWTELCRLELHYNDLDAGKRTYLPPELVLDDIARQDQIPRTNIFVRDVP